MKRKWLSLSILPAFLLFVLVGCSNDVSGEPTKVDPITLEPLTTLEEKQFNYFVCIEKTEISLKGTLSYRQDSNPDKDSNVSMWAKENCIHHLD